MEKAAKADPKNLDYAFQYVYSFRRNDPAKYTSLLHDLISRFPGSEQAMQSLYYLALGSSNKEAVVYYNELYRRYPSNNLFLGGMSPYFVLLLSSEPDKAFELALSMVLNKDTKNRHAWKERVRVASDFLEVRRLLGANMPLEAADILRNVSLGADVNVFKIDARESLALLKAEVADAADHTQEAYDSLAVYYSKEPGKALRSAMLGYAAKLGRSEKQVDSAIWELRKTSAQTATGFSLDNFLKEEKISLSDFEGKVVLLTYWFPGCPPCREEFPHFESVLKRYTNKEIVYLGINGVPEQDEYVIQFMKSSGNSFIPLREDPVRNRGNLNANSYPTNFLIDQRGRIIFSGFNIGGHNEEMLELMINELISSGKFEG